MHRVHLVVSGRVQGVGFRWFVARHARGLDVRGEVRNMPDGSVEVVAEGRRETLEALVSEVRHGPSAARVEDVAEMWSEGAARFRGFEIRG